MPKIHSINDLPIEFTLPVDFFNNTAPSCCNLYFNDYIHFFNLLQLVKIPR